MPKRTAKFVSAIFAGILASSPLVTTSRGETAPADDCLSSPKAETPPGSHWRYRIDHKRHCWYLRQEGGRLSQAASQNQAAPQNIPPPAKPPAPRADPLVQPSPSDAHAEWRAGTPPDDGAATAAVTSPANATTSNESLSRGFPIEKATSAVVASRWPELSRGTAPASPQSGTINVAASPPQPQAAAAPPQPQTAMEPVSLPDADQSMPAGFAMRSLIAAAVGVLGLACMIVVFITRLGRRRRFRRRRIDYPQRRIWESTDDDRIVLSDYPPSYDRNQRHRFGRGVQPARVGGDRMSEAIARMSR